MRITDVESIPLRAELRSPFRFGNVVRTRSSNVLLRVTTDEGFVGYGEACPVPQLSAETQETVCSHVRDRIAELLIGADPLSWRPLLEQARRRLYGSPFTLAAVDTALLDLAGKALGVPIATLLGGRHRESIEVHGSVGWEEEPELVADNAEAQAQSFHALKHYAGRGTLREDLRRLEAARERVGPEHPFLVDVNGLWSPLKALSAGATLRDLGVVMVEQPVAPADAAGQAEVSRVYGDRHQIDVAADERVLSPASAVEIAREGGARSVNVGLSKLGGVLGAFDTATAARAAQLGVTVGSVVELGVASAAGLQLAAALPELAHPSYLMGYMKYERQVTWPAFDLHDGHLTVPTGSGLGVEIDEEAVAAMDRRRTAELS